MPEQFNARQKCIIYDKRFGLSADLVNSYNRKIQAAISRATEIDTRYYLAGKLLNRAIFEQKFTNESQQADFLEFIERKIEHLKSNSDLGKYILGSYGTTLLKAREFQQKWLFGEFDEDLLKRFEKWMVGKKLAINTRWKEHKNIKVFVKLAIKEELLYTDPYEEFKVKKVQGDRDFLEDFEVKTLLSLYNNRELNPGLQEVLARFLFSCFTGIRISDSDVITEENIINNQLIFTPAKGRQRFGKVLRIPLNRTAQSFIERRMNKSFHVISDNNTNLALKEIADFAGIQKNLTFHVSRHTFATQFLQQGGRVETLQKLLGHRKIETTMIYVHLADRRKKQEIMMMDNLRVVRSEPDADTGT